MAEYFALGKYKPTGPWLLPTGPTNGFLAGGFFADHPSFAIANETQLNRLGSSQTPGDSVVGNIWEWTSSACRLCGVDLVELQCSTAHEQIVEGVTRLIRPLGTVRLELASDLEFSNGFFVEWETIKDAETLIGPTIGVDNTDDDQATKYSSLFGPRTVYHPNDETQPETDESPHVLSPLPSWTTQQFTGDVGLGIIVNNTDRPITIGRLFTPGFSDIYAGGQSITFIRTVMRFGKLDGSDIVERTDRGWEWPRLWPRAFMTLGVHNNKAVGSVNGSFFRSIISPNDHEFLTKQRWARVRCTTAETNTIQVTGRFGTLQWAPTGPTGIIPAVSVQAAGPRAGVPTCRTIANSDVTASQRSISERNAATGPAPLLCSYWREPTTDPISAGAFNNPAQDWLAQRLESPAAFDQPSGHPAQFTLNAVAANRPLTVVTEFDFTQIVRSVNSLVPQNDADTPNGTEDAKLPTVAVLPRQRFFGGRTGQGWLFPPEWTFPASFGAPDYEGTPTLAGSETPVVAATEKQWSRVIANAPTQPWLRFGDRGSLTTFVMAQNAGMASYVGNTTGGPALTLLNAYDMPFFRSNATRLTDVMGHVDLTMLPRVGEHFYSLDQPPVVTLGNGAQRLEQTITQQIKANFLIGVNQGNPRFVGPFPTVPVHQIYADQLEWAIVESATCTPLQCDYAASIERVVPEPFAPVYSVQQAGQDPAIPMTKVTDPARRFIRPATDAWVRIRWRKTWRTEINVLYANFECTGTSDPVVVGQRFISLQLGAIDIPGFDESITLAYPGPKQTRKTFTFLFEDYFNTDVRLTESEWESLEQGNQVSVELIQTAPDAYGRRAAGQPPTINSVQAGISPRGPVDQIFQSAAWVYDRLPALSANWTVFGRLNMTLQFLP